MNVFLAVLLVVYLAGMFVCWYFWSDRMMTGDWLQDSFTLVLWPLLAILIAILYLKS